VKPNKSLVFICFLAFIFLKFCLSSNSDATPAPDIKANNVDSVVILDTDDTLSITVSIEAGTSAGMNADWWVAADTPFGWHYYIYPGSWFYAPDVVSILAAYQGPLFNFTDIELLNITALPVGIYTFFFGVDTNVNGIIDSPLFYDSVSVNVSDGGGVIDISGYWEIYTTNIYGTEVGPDFLDLTQSDSTITGIWVVGNGAGGTTGEWHLISGALNGTSITFYFDEFPDLRLTGQVINNDTMSGTLDYIWEDLDTWSAERTDSIPDY
jgi:hypothetical protein